MKLKTKVKNTSKSVIALTLSGVFAMSGLGIIPTYAQNVKEDNYISPNAVIQEIRFDNNIDDGLSDVERGRIRAANVFSHPSGGGSLNDEQLAIIGTSDFVQVQTTFYIEQVSPLTRSGFAEPELLSVSEDVYFQELARREAKMDIVGMYYIIDPSHFILESNSYNKYLEESVTYNNEIDTNDMYYENDWDYIINEFEEDIQKPMSEDIQHIQPFNTGSWHTGGGLLRMEVLLFATDMRITNFRYVGVAAFIWDGMPSQRLTDIFGISRGSNTVTFGGFNGFTEVYRRTFAGVALFGQPLPLQSTGWRGRNHLPNDSSNNYHYAIRINMPRDTGITNVIQGTWVTRHFYLAKFGEVSFTGGLSGLTFIPGGIQVINFNHWGTYAHQTRGFALQMSAGVNVNFPSGVSGGFSITPNRISDFTTRRVTHAASITIS